MFVWKSLFFALILIHFDQISSQPITDQNQNDKAIEGHNELALHLLQMLSNEDNTFFSPTALSSALLILLNGAKGETEKELRLALDIPQDIELKDINNKMKALLEALNKKNSKDLQMIQINRLLISSSSDGDKSGIKEDFVEKIKDVYKSDVISVDFNKNSKKVTKDINEWISLATNDKMRQIFRDNLDPKSSLVLASAVYFGGKWKKAFDPKLSTKDNFYNLVSYRMPGLATKIQFMSSEDKYRVKSIEELKSSLIELPFSNDISMIIVLPDRQQDLEFLNENMTLNQLDSAIDDLMKVEPITTKVTLPKFKLDTDYDLRETLEEFDVKTLFSSPDLSNALTSDKKDKTLSVAVHKASIDVNEEGIEAPNQVAAPDTTTTTIPEVKVNRPFVFLIRDNTNGLMAFVGRVQTLVDEELLSLGFI